jgi:hypothetical protein
MNTAVPRFAESGRVNRRGRPPDNSGCLGKPNDDASAWRRQPDYRLLQEAAMLPWCRNFHRRATGITLSDL